MLPVGKHNEEGCLKLPNEKLAVYGKLNLIIYSILYDICFLYV